MRIFGKSSIFAPKKCTERMKKRFLALLTILLPLAAEAQESQTGYNFLRLPVSAHAAALGGDNISIIEDDASLMFANPALLASVSDKTINLNFMTYMEGATTASASFNRVVNEKASWAVMAQYMDYGKMKEVDENNVQTGEFSARDIALAGSFCYNLSQKIVGGITARIVTSYIGSYNSLAMGVDLGINYYDPDHDFSLSVAAKNLGGELKAYDEDYGKMPLDVQLGASKGFANMPFRVSCTLVDLNHWNYGLIKHLVVGIDATLSSQFYLSAGYNFRRADEMKVASSDGDESSHMAGLSFGAGLQLERFKLQAAYAKYHVSSSSILVNVSYTL